MQLRESPKRVRITVHVKPRSPETKLTVEPDGTIIVHVSASPSEGKANRELLKWLAKKLGKSSADVRLVSGIHSKTKVIEIFDIDQADVERILGITLASTSRGSAA